MRDCGMMNPSSYMVDQKLVVEEHPQRSTAAVSLCPVAKGSKKYCDGMVEISDESLLSSVHHYSPRKRCRDRNAS